MPSTAALRQALHAAQQPRPHYPPREQLAADYNRFLATCLPHWCPVPCAPFHVKAAHALRDDPAHAAVWMWFRGAAKSTHASLLLPLWLLLQPQPAICYVLLVGKTYEAACKLLAPLRQELATNATLAHYLGPLQGSPWREGFFVTPQGIAFQALGLGQSPRGLRHGTHRPDLIICDDLDHRQLANNPSRLARAERWLLEDLLGTQDVGATRFLLVGNRWSKHTLVHRLSKTAGITTHRVDALDPKGQPTWPEKYASGSWFEQRRRLIGERAFAREYMNEPLPEGLLFKPEWIQWAPSLPLAAYTCLICYIDPAWSSGPAADYKAAKLWGSYTTSANATPRYHNLRAFVRRSPLTSLIAWCYGLLREAQAAGVAIFFFIEDAFQQHQLLSAFHEHRPPGLPTLPIQLDKRRKPAKHDRIEQLAPLFEQGLLSFAQEERHTHDMRTAIDQLLAFGPGSHAHDDAPDADEGALHLLQTRTHQAHAPAPRLGKKDRGRFGGY